MDCDKVSDDHLYFHIVPLRIAYIHWPFVPTSKPTVTAAMDFTFPQWVFAVDPRRMRSFNFSAPLPHSNHLDELNLSASKSI